MVCLITPWFSAKWVFYCIVEEIFIQFFFKIKGVIKRGEVAISSGYIPKVNAIYSRKFVYVAQFLSRMMLLILTDPNYLSTTSVAQQSCQPWGVFPSPFIWFSFQVSKEKPAFCHKPTIQFPLPQHHSSSNLKVINSNSWNISFHIFPCHIQIYVYIWKAFPLTFFNLNGLS